MKFLYKENKLIDALESIVKHHVFFKNKFCLENFNKKEIEAYIFQIDRNKDFQTISISLNSLDVIINSGKELSTELLYNMVAKVSGIWIHQNYFGLTFELIRINSL